MCLVRRFRVLGRDTIVDSTHQPCVKLSVVPTKERTLEEVIPGYWHCLASTPPDAETAGTILVRIPERLVDMFTGGSKGMRRFFLLLALAAAIAGFPFLSSQRSFARKKASYCDAIVYADLPEWLVVGGAVLVCVAILWRYLQRYPRRAAPGRR